MRTGARLREGVFERGAGGPDLLHGDGVRELRDVRQPARRVHLVLEDHEDGAAALRHRQRLWRQLSVPHELHKPDAVHGCISLYPKRSAQQMRNKCAAKSKQWC